jgi:HEAT repeat protein
MESIFERLWRLGPAALVVKAIIVIVVGDVLLLAIIMLRRKYRKRLFAKRDARAFQLRQVWDQVISGQIPHETWRNKPSDRRIVETIALDAFESAGPEESARLLKFLRASGLIERRIFEARKFTGWRRMRALVALGRTRATEGIPALAEALSDGDLEIRLAALRGLGRTACPQAGEAILASLADRGFMVPPLPLQSALVQCCVERPQLLLPYVRHAEHAMREVLGRVLGEVATPSLGMDMLEFAGDKLPELRAAAARALAHADPSLGLDLLTELARDPVWFVRLRAVVSFGKLSDSRAIPALLLGLTDSNRLVRLRAAESLVELKTDMAAVFERVLATRDRYGLHAYLTALENRNLREKLKSEIVTSTQIDKSTRWRLLKVLEEGSLPAEDLAGQESVPTEAEWLP